MILNYDHSSSRLAELESSAEWNRNFEERDIAELFSRPLEFLPTNAVPKSSPTSNLLFKKTLEQVGEFAQECKIVEPYKPNPVDYTLLNKDGAKEALAERQAEYNAVHLKPFTPLPSRLPLIKQVELCIFSKKAMQNKYVTLSAILALTNMTCVRAEPFFSEISDAAMGIKKGQVCGARVTLVDWQMFNFIDTLVQVVMPRLRDFGGVNPKASGDASLTLNLNEQAMALFPGVESVLEMFPQLFEFQIIFKTTAQTEAELLQLLSSFQIPFLGSAVDDDVKGSDEPVDPWAEFKKKRKPPKKQQRK